MTRHLGIAEALREAMARKWTATRACSVWAKTCRARGWGGAVHRHVGAGAHGFRRMINTPIAELGSSEWPAAPAMLGLRPIVDVQYGDFLLLAFDRFRQQHRKMRYMSGGQIRMPLSCALRWARPPRQPARQNVERYFVGVPG